MLGEVYEQLDLGVPQIVVAPNTEGKFVGYIDLQIPHNGIVIQTVRCSSSSSHCYWLTERLRVCYERLKEECDFQFMDINYDDSLLYKTYTTTKQPTVLRQKNEYVNERIQLRNAIGDCYATVNRITVGLPTGAADSSEAMPNQHA
uniref:Uncharacterized protein n=1 Tax=Ananas comosus var. bracteatus TaxID=296719 RepID=A0A6V7NZ27_ANACO|nr:unnamed protein product [Ananas comosus var. bracteatus]